MPDDRKAEDSDMDLSSAVLVVMLPAVLAAIVFAGGRARGRR